MIAVDTNLLVYAHRPEFPGHASAKELLRALAESPRPWALVTHCFIEFAGVVSHPRRFLQPSSASEIRAQIEAWRASPSVQLLGDSVALIDRFLDLLASGRAIGAQVHDARIAAACLAGGVSELWTCDRDYGRYPDLRTRNPLVTRPPATAI